MDKREYYCASRVDLCPTSLVSATNQMIGNRTSLQGELALKVPRVVDMDERAEIR